MRYAVSFDVWNTLISSDRFFERFSQRLAEALGRGSEEVRQSVLAAYDEMKRARFGGLVDDSDVVRWCMATLLSWLGGNASREHVSRVLAELAVEDPSYLVLDNAYEVLRELKAMGYALVVVGNVVFWPGIYTRILLERLGIGKLLDAQVYADEVACSKPKPRIFVEAEAELARMGLEARLIAHVGDSFKDDFLGALGAGLAAVLVDRSGNLRGELIPGRGYAVSSLGEIPDLVRANAGRWANMGLGIDKV